MDTPFSHPPVSVLRARLEAAIKRRKAAEVWEKASSPSFDTAGKWDASAGMARLDDLALRHAASQADLTQSAAVPTTEAEIIPHPVAMDAVAQEELLDYLTGAFNLHFRPASDRHHMAVMHYGHRSLVIKFRQ